MIENKLRERERKRERERERDGLWREEWLEFFQIVEYI